MILTEERRITETEVTKKQRIVFLTDISTAYMLEDNCSLLVSSMNPETWDVALDDYGDENWYELDEREPMTMDTIIAVQRALGIKFIIKNKDPIFVDGYEVIEKNASVSKIY
jgi:hypothetical protein|tara:strand:- start:2101 stop:2436 length:336 start_codon:yes stop_codon:yes gene_type:complete